ncbi:MAG: hypothetical protein QOG63_2774, partial [Thermoleophilaceae bacterium]|nr:hypothetical protein [Thermoleophilaceae bacterium]
MRRIARRIAIVGFAALVALAPATAHAADRWFAVPQSVPNSGPAEATPATWVGAGPGGVYFATSAALLPEDGDSSIDVYRRQGASLTVATPGTTGNVGGPQAVSRDGSTVVFSSSEALVPEDQDPDLADLYATTGGVTRLVSVSDPNAPFSFLSIILPSLRVSDDGRFVAFSTYEGLAASDGDNRFDTYVWDRDTGQTALASAPDSGGSDVTLDFGGMSRNGRYVFMETSAPLTSDDTDGATDVYRYDTSSDSLALFTPGTTQSYSFAGISADGTHLFYRTAESLDTADTDGGQVDVYQYANGVTTLISTAPGAASGANDADFQRASEHGAVVFFTTAEQLTSADVDGG